MLASQIISNTIFPLRKEDTAEDILTMLSMNRLKELPVVEDDLVLGVVSESQAYEMNLEQKAVDVLLPGKVLSVEPNTHMFEIITKVSMHNLSMIPVVNSEGKYLGLVTQEDIFKAYASGFSFKEPGSIVIIEMSKRSYSMAEISQIVESENAAILACFLSDSEKDEAISVTLKINKKDIRSILAGFERYDYEIKASYSEEEYFDNFKERYDMLMHYLNV